MVAVPKDMDDLLGRNMTFQDVIAVANLIVVAVTAGVVTWYTWETRQLRRATLRQSALQIRPFLAIEYSEDRNIWVHNLGKGVARDIRFQDVRFGEGVDTSQTFLTIVWRPIDFIPERPEARVAGRGRVRDARGARKDLAEAEDVDVELRAARQGAIRVHRRLFGSDTDALSCGLPGREGTYGTAAR